MITNYNIIKNIPNIGADPFTVSDTQSPPSYCLQYIFENLKYQHTPNTLWLEFGTYSGRSINYIAQFTQDKVYGFDSFEGLPEDWRLEWTKGSFNRDGVLPKVEENVELIKGWFNETLEKFLSEHREEVSFLHLDADLYSSTKYVLDMLTQHKRIGNGCIILFDELINFRGFDGEASELRALSEWLSENPHIKYEWMGANGEVYFDNKEYPYHQQQAFLRILE